MIENVSAIWENLGSSKRIWAALTSVAQLDGRRPTQQRVAGSIPGQGCEISPQLGHV